MYQSIPKRVYTQKESAMPKIPISQPFSNEKEHRDAVSDISKIPKIPKIPKISKLSKISKNLETDDLLLIGLLILLLSEEGDNELLVLAVAFLLFF